MSRPQFMGLVNIRCTPPVARNVARIRYFSVGDTATVRWNSQWRIGSWNQHRVGSYAQRNCPWIAPLQSLGAPKAETSELLKSLPVDYDVHELHGWLSACDAVAVQEVDDAFRDVMRCTPAAGTLTESARHVDGRGVEVDCTVAVLVRDGVDVISVERGEVVLPISGRRRGYARRSHAAVLLRKAEEEGEGGLPVVLMSLHLHPPRMVDESGIAYLEYIAPLKEALQRLLTATSSSVALSLVGDFNTTPEDFLARTSGDKFWTQFTPAASSNGATAHHSNPCRVGDFGVFGVIQSHEVDGKATAPEFDSKVGVWSCTASGDADFAAFEHYCDEVVSSVMARLASKRIERDVDSAQSALQRALASLLEVPRRPPPPAMQALASEAVVRPRQPPPPPPSDGRTALREALRHLEAFRQSSAPAVRRLRRGLLTSDHRPLVFLGRF